MIAGVDIGNATTEVVLLRAAPGGAAQVVGAARLPTRGRKGSPASVAGAVNVVRRAERGAGVTASVVVAAPLRAVDTAVYREAGRRPDTGRLRVVATGVRTAGGSGAGVGRPVPLSDVSGRPAPRDPVVVLVPAGVGYRPAAATIAAALPRGWDIRGAVVASDEGVLVANRVPAAIPVFDEVDPAGVAGADLLALEVRGAGAPLTVLGDALALGAALGGPLGAGAAAAMARSLRGASNALLALDPGAGPAPRRRRTELGWSLPTRRCGASWTPFAKWPAGPPGPSRAGARPTWTGRAGIVSPISSPPTSAG